MKTYSIYSITVVALLSIGTVSSAPCATTQAVAEQSQMCPASVSAPLQTGGGSSVVVLAANDKSGQDVVPSSSEQPVATENSGKGDSDNTAASTDKAAASTDKAAASTNDPVGDPQPGNGQDGHHGHHGHHRSGDK